MFKLFHARRAAEADFLTVVDDHDGVPHRAERVVGHDASLERVVLDRAVGHARRLSVGGRACAAAEDEIREHEGGDES